MSVTDDETYVLALIGTSDFELFCVGSISSNREVFCDVMICGCDVLSGVINDGSFDGCSPITCFSFNEMR